jgi:hypothetical protein
MENEWKPFDLNEAPPMQFSPENIDHCASQTSSSNPGYVVDSNQHTSSSRSKEFREDDAAIQIVYDASGNPFNLYDWSFLRVDPAHKETAAIQEEFLQFLKLHYPQRRVDPEGFFFIERRNAVAFMKNFRGMGLNSKFNKPLDFDFSYRSARYYAILLRISDNKINLKRYSKFSHEIVEAWMERVERKYQLSRQPQGTEKINDFKKFIQDITKVTHLLLVIVLSFFKEHEHKFLTVNEVNNHLNFIKQLWVRLEEGKLEVREAWEKQVQAILTFRPDAPTKKERDQYSLCWRFVKYWLKENNMQLTKMKKDITHQDTMVRVINKMIFFSNHKTMYEKKKSNEEEG